MTDPFLRKAETGIKSAKVLLELGDTDGACSRAYYAMYDATRACLTWAGAEPERGEFKTHRGLIAAFGAHLIKSGLFSVEVGRAIQRAQTVRQIADYEASPVPLDDARETVGNAEIFVITTAALIAKPYQSPSASTLA